MAYFSATGTGGGTKQEKPIFLGTYSNSSNRTWTNLIFKKPDFLSLLSCFVAYYNAPEHFAIYGNNKDFSDITEYPSLDYTTIDGWNIIGSVYFNIYTSGRQISNVDVSQYKYIALCWRQDGKGIIHDIEWS